jgi:hypothetical protein
MQIKCTLFITASSAAHNSTVLSQNAETEPRTNHIHSDSKAMHRLQAESTFVVVDLDAGSNSGIDKNKNGKIMFMRPQMKNYVYENILLIEAGHKNPVASNILNEADNVETHKSFGTTVPTY